MVADLVGKMDSARTAESEGLIFQSCLWHHTHFSHGFGLQRQTLIVGAQFEICGVQL